MTSAADNSDIISRIIEPECVAVIGATEDTSKYGGRVIDHLVRHEFTGRIVPVNPGRQTIFGIPAVPSILAAGCPVDVALLAVPSDGLEAAIDQCVQAGVRCAVIISSGLGEQDDAGKRREEGLVRAARAGGMRLLGPNCLGYVSPFCNLALTPSFMLSHVKPARGGVTLLSQSGALMATMFGRATDNGVGFRACVSLGNQADLTIEEFMTHFASDAKTTAIVVYAEEIRDTARFFQSCETARANGKHVIVCKAGASAAGQGTAMSHTASVAGDYSAFKAVCTRHQVLLSDDPDGASLSGAVLSRFGIGHGRRVAVISGSGGAVASVSDYLSLRGFEIPQVSPATAEQFKSYYGTYSGYAAVDYGALPSTMKGRDAWVQALGDILKTLVADPNVDAVAYVMTAQPMMIPVSKMVAGFAAQSSKPVMLALTAGSAAEPVRKQLRENGSMFVDGLGDLVTVLNMLSHPKTAPEDFLPASSVDGDVAKALSHTTGTEADARAFLQRADVRLPAEAAVGTLDDALKAAERLGYPLVLKAVCQGVVHKSDQGLVKLGITSPAVLKERWAEMDDALRDPQVSAAVVGRMLQQQIAGGVELFLGTRWVEGLGTIVAVGFGGTLVELVKDVAVVAAPVSESGAERLLRGLKLWPLLAGFRGGKPMDVKAAAQAVSRLSVLAASAGSALTELDVNPLIVLPEGTGVVAVDCRLNVQHSTAGEKP